MQIETNTNKIKIIIGVVAVVLITAGVSAYFLNKQSTQEDRPENTPDYNAPTDEQKNAGIRAKEEFLERQDEKEKNEPVENNQDEPAVISTEVTISSVGQNGTVFQIRTIVEALDDNGLCTLTLTKSGADSVTQEAGTQILGSYSVCKGFDVPTESMQKGAWQADISYRGSGGQMGSVKRTIEIE